MFRKFAFALVLMLVSIPMLAQHSVTLNWTASTDAAANPTLTYNLYRATTTTDCSQPSLLTFVKQNSTPVTAITYSDANVSVGHSYCYQAKAALFSLESGPSNTASAVILPASPTNLGATTQ